MLVPGVGNTAGERVTNCPEPIALRAKAKRVDGPQFATAKKNHLGVARAVGAAGLGRRGGAFGRPEEFSLAAEVGEDLLGIALPGTGRGTGSRASQPAFVGSCHG